MKRLSVFLMVSLTLFALFAGGTAESTSDERVIDELTITFVPSRDTEDIVVATAPLGNLLKKELASSGWTVKSVKILVSTSYESAGEALDAGTTDIAFIPAGTYVKYSDGAEAILTALREGKSIDSSDAKVWNENKPTTSGGSLVVGYRALILSGVTEKGRALADKVNRGEDLGWEELDACSWGVGTTTSSAGYIYPSLWLYGRFGRTVADLSRAVQTTYASAFAGLSSGMYDIITCYADAREDYVTKWTQEWGRTKSIWNEVDVIGVSDFIMNDTISISRTSTVMQDREFVRALQDAFMSIAETDEGKTVLKIYNHYGYTEAVDSDYDSARTAQKIFR